MTLTRDLGQFVSDLSPNRVPEEAGRIARIGFIDCIGVMFAGREEEPTRLLRDVLQPPAGPATLCFTDIAPAPGGAWINGVAAHALDYDDVALRGHPSTVLVPAILAEAETLDLSGRDMVAAYVAGYEVWAELVRRESRSHHGAAGRAGADGAGAGAGQHRLRSGLAWRLNRRPGRHPSRLGRDAARRPGAPGQRPCRPAAVGS
jgi:2-methylcitrate dehydratase PrpD